GATNVQGRIAYYPDFVHCSPVAEVRGDGRPRRQRDVVSIEMIVAESAQSEMVPEAVMGQFPASPFTNIASEQAEQNRFVAPEQVQQARNSRQYLAAMGRQVPRKVGKIGGGQASPGFGAIFDSMQAKKIASNGPVGSSAVGNAVHHRLQTKFRNESRFHRRF